MVGSLPVLNQTEAKFDCTFGRGCDGICCQNGRPSLYPEERKRIADNLEKILPKLRPEAQAVIEEAGPISGRHRYGLPMVRVVGGWCVFFNEGCVLHKVGAEEGDKYRYKPAQCSLFPLAKDEKDRWYIRQHNYQDEKWDLFCLSPTASPRPAVESLQTEMALAARYDAESAQTNGGSAAHAARVEHSPRPNGNTNVP